MIRRGSAASADDLRAQLRAAEAQVVQAREAVEESKAGVRKSRTDVSLAGKTLKDMGYTDVRNLGGFKDWVEGGGAVE